MSGFAGQEFGFWKHPEVQEMQSFIVEHLLGEVVDVYCGGPDVFNGAVEACADNVLTLGKDGKRTHIVVDKIVAVWRA